MDCLREQFYEGVVLDGRFETVSPLNHGSFGMVFMAQDLQTDEFVAIKCLTKRSAVTEADSAFAVDERSEELDCHARLGTHPNIVNLIHSFETEAHIFIVLEFCSRGDLYEAIRMGTGPLQTEHVRQFMFQLVDAVAYIHSKGMYHRDIKPENIFLTQSGEMKLGDFGLATKDKWSFETNVGSDRYMSPEQYDSAGAGYAPEKADIWAIGICLLNILFFRNPFTAPTVSDPLFLDFSRDKQSLFDVFPTMSQDTYEVIAQCMSLDPDKRSLEGVRAALHRLVSFTTFDEALDDFPSAERHGIASANREPLRTPSIQSPMVNTDNFPWMKALNASFPLQSHHLPIIADESYTEELFPSSEESNKDWFSVGQQTPSMSSVLDSSLGTSLKRLSIHPPQCASVSKVSPNSQSSSLPIKMFKASFCQPTLIDRKEPISKSWSDIWEEEEEEAHKHITVRGLQNSRTWSQESLSHTVTPRQNSINDRKQPLANLFLNTVKTSEPNDIDRDLTADGFFIDDISPDDDLPQLSPRLHPPTKTNTVDKWSTLGERRRAFTGSSVSEREMEIMKGMKETVKLGSGISRTGISGAVVNIPKEPNLKERDKGCPWTRDRARNYHNGRPRRLGNFGDLEWVGGFSHLQS